MRYTQIEPLPITTPPIPADNFLFSYTESKHRMVKNVRYLGEYFVNLDLVLIEYFEDWKMMFTQRNLQYRTWVILFSNKSIGTF